MLDEILKCRICEDKLEPNPVFQVHPSARILIVGQAPGLKVHLSNKPFNDASGDRLRTWMGINKDDFYSDKIAIVPMALCYPGKGSSGDKAPPTICAKTHHADILKSLPNIELTLLIGSYAQKHYCKDDFKNLSERVMHFENYLPDYFVLPHPSPRNNIWLKKNEWFEKTAIPVLKKRVNKILR